MLLVTAVFGTLSPSGSEVGPFLSIEQTMFPQTTADQDRTRAFSAYNVVGQIIGAVGSGAAVVPALLGAEPLTGYRRPVRAESDAPSPPNALCQTGQADFPAIGLDSRAYTDLSLVARFKPVSEKEDQAGGLRAGRSASKLKLETVT